jgi:hypothetical protein
MRNIFYFFLMILFSCNQAGKEESVPEKVPEKKDSSLIPLEPYFAIGKITEEEFQKHTEGRTGTIQNEIADSGIVQRMDKLLKENEGHISVYDNVIYVGSKAYHNSDSKVLEKNVQHYVYAVTRELALMRIVRLASSGWELYERNNGSGHACLGFPVFSPDSSKILVVNSSMPNRYDEKGIQYFIKQDEKYILQWKIMLKDWFATDLYWNSDSSVVCKKIYHSSLPKKEDADSLQYLHLTIKK